MNSQPSKSEKLRIIHNWCILFTTNKDIIKGIHWGILSWDDFLEDTGNLNTKTEVIDTAFEIVRDYVLIAIKEIEYGQT